MPVPKLPLRLTGLSYPYHLWWWRRSIRTRPILTDWNYRHRAIFVHIPKTAGTSVLAGLGAPPAFDTHAPSRIYRVADAALYACAYKFAIVRNPWDRFASCFHFMKHGTSWSLQQRWAQTHIGDLDFAGFARRLREPLFRAAVMAERFFWPQTFWLAGAGRADGVDEVHRYENLEDAMRALRQRFELDPACVTPHLRKVSRPDFRALYDEESKAIVGRLYRRDIEILGYSFSDAGAGYAS
jgi:hypothetical protein